MPGEFFLGTWERREREPRLPAVQKRHVTSVWFDWP